MVLLGKPRRSPRHRDRGGERATETEVVRLAITGTPLEAIWISVHRDLQRAPRMRATMDYLTEALRDAEDALHGGRVTRRSVRA